MKKSNAPIVPRSAIVDPAGGDGARDYHELWFALASRGWRSVVFVPADPEGSAAPAAAALASVGRQLHNYPIILYTMAKPADYWPAMEMLNAAATAAGAPVIPVETEPMNYASAVQVVAEAAARPNESRSESSKVIVAIQPVVSEPLGLAITQAADAVVLCLRAGRTSQASVRRTIELIGRHRIAGCVLDSSRRPARSKR